MKIIVFIAFFLLESRVIAQKQFTPIPTVLKNRNLKIGDQVPDFVIKNIINDKYSAVRVKDFKDKLLIIDFWATNCAGCVSALPKMIALQEEFGDKIKILPVTYEREAVVRKFLKQSRLVKKLTIPTVVEDNILSKWFKHQFIPHEVWIYKGKIVAFTASDYVDGDNVRLILSGKKNDWPIKYDFYPRFDYSQPLLKVNEKHIGLKPRLSVYSAIFGYIKQASFAQGVSYDSLQNMRRNYIINTTILDAYFNTWGKIREMRGISKKYFPDPNRIVLEVTDSLKYLSVRSAKYIEAWKEKHLFCYESMKPYCNESEDEQVSGIVDDLDHLLNLHGRYETRKTKCLILVRTGKEDKLKSGGGKPEFIKDERLKRIRNISLRKFVEILNQEIAEVLPILDESGYSGMIDMDLDITSWKDYNSLRKALKVYDLDLKEEERELEMFVLTEILR